MGFEMRPCTPEHPSVIEANGIAERFMSMWKWSVLLSQKKKIQRPSGTTTVDELSLYTTSKNWEVPNWANHGHHWRPRFDFSSQRKSAKRRSKTNTEEAMTRQEGECYSNNHHTRR